jgi:hypothetical protein
MLGCDLQRIQNRRDPEIFIVLLEHLFGGAEESYKKPNPLAQEYKAEVSHKRSTAEQRGRSVFLLCLLSSLFRFNFACFSIQYFANLFSVDKESNTKELLFNM